MRATDIAARLRDRCPSLRVVLTAAQGAEPTAYPAAYVVLLRRVVSPNPLVAGAHDHVLTWHYAVDVTVRSAREPATGGPAVDALHDVLDEIDQALAGWAPYEDWGPLELGDGELLGYGAGWCTWRQHVRTWTVLRTYREP